MKNFTQNISGFQLTGLFYSFLITVFSLIGTQNTFAQNAIVGPDFSTGWGGASCPTTNFNFTPLAVSAGTSYITTRTVGSTGIKFWRLGVDWSGTTGQFTNTIGSNTPVLPSTSYNLNTNCTTSGALQYNVTNTTFNYVFKTLNAGTNPTGTWVFFEVQGTVNTIGSVAQIPLAANVFPGQAVTVTANMSASQTVGQNVYLRYTTNGWGSSNVLPMTYTGSAATAVIPATANTASAAISYFIFTSGPSNVALDGSNADLFTINANGSIPTATIYTVRTGWVTANNSNWSTPATWTANAIPPTAASMGAVVIGHNVTLDQAAIVSGITINTGITLIASDASPRTLTVSAAANSTSLVNNGTWLSGAGGSTVVFTSTGANLVHTITGTCAFNNVSIIRSSGTPNIGVTFSAASTINGSFTLNLGAFVQTTPPTYGASSTLIYNSGNAYGISTEWTAGATSGAGYPNDVQIGINVVNSGLAIGNSNTYNMRGNFTFSNANSITGTFVTMTSSTLNIGGSWINNTTPALANFTSGTGTVGFTGTSTQTIGGANTLAGYAFNNLTANMSTGSLTVNRAITVANTLTVNGGGTLSLNGNSLSVTSVIGTGSAAIISNNHASIIVTLTISNGSGSSYAGSFQNGAAATLTIVKNGAGIQTFSGTVASTYSGTTTVNAGTLVVGGVAGMSANSNYTFSGGNLSFSGVALNAAINAGTLNITSANTSIDMGASNPAFSVNFANSSTLSPWTGATDIFITNWTAAAGRVINFAGTANGLLPAQLDKINFDNFGVGAKFVGNTEIRPALLYVTLGSGINKSFIDPTAWEYSDLPSKTDGSESFFIKSGDTLVTTGAKIDSFLSVQIAGNLNMGAKTITIRKLATQNAFFRISGSVTMTSSSIINLEADIIMQALSSTARFSPSGILNFQGAFIITSNSPNAVLLPNVNLRASVNFGDNSTIQNGSSLNMLAGGFVDSKAPFYASGSTLVYKVGVGGSPYGRGAEWSTLVGRGYPDSVLVTNNTILNLNFGNGSRKMGGSLNIDAGSEATMVGMLDTLVVLKNVTVNGILRLGSFIGSDLKLGGNYTLGANGFTFNNQRAVIFNGSSGNQLVTKINGGPLADTLYFDFFVVDKPSGDVKMTTGTHAYITAPVVNISFLRVLQLIRGDLDMNGGLFTVYGEGTNSIIVLVDNGPTARRIYTGTGTGEFRIRGTNSIGVAKFTVVSQNNGKLKFDDNVEVSTNVGVDFGTGNITTINARLRIDQNGYVIVNSPNYASDATLIYNNTGSFNRNFEWNSNTYSSFGTGYPHDVIVQNNTALDLNFYPFTASSLGCSGKLNIEAGSSVVTSNMSKQISIGDSLNIKGTLTLSTDTLGNLNVGGSWNRTGTFTQNNRMVTFDSTNAASIRATGGQTFSRMTINKQTAGSTVAVDSAVTMTNELFLQRGAVTLNNDVIIKSDNTRTARIGQTTTPSDISITYSTGKFEIQRYLSIANTTFGRRWRLLTAPLKSSIAPTINAAWQDGKSNSDRTSPQSLTAGYGTIITKSTAFNAADGYDQGSTNNPSIYKYVGGGTPVWQSLANTNSGAITDQQGYMVFVRGDRTMVVSGTTVAGIPTTLRPKGQINIGPVSILLGGLNNKLIGNPYASSINFNNVTVNGSNPATTAGISFYIWDPKFSKAPYNVGGFVTFTSRGDGRYNVTANSSGYAAIDSGIIQSGAAFLMAPSFGNIDFNENCKRSSNSQQGIASRPVDNVNIVKANKFESFTANLLSGISSTDKIVDGVINVGNNDFENAINERDAPKLISFQTAEKISIYREGKEISIEHRKKIIANDTIFYNLSKLNQANYHLALIGKDIDNTLFGIVEDKFLKTATIISVSDTNIIPFTVTSDSTSASDRFSVVFKSSAGFTNIKAATVNNDIIVDWNLISEFKIVNHEVERSTDGVSFKTVGNLLSNGNSFMPVKYNWIDVSPYHGIYYYRIKAINTNGVAIYSSIAKIKLMKSNPTIYIAPNPVTDNIIHLQMNTVTAGRYTLRLLNNAGQVMQTRTINHTGTNTLHTWALNQYVTKGTYQVELTAAGKKTIMLQVLIQ